MNLWPDFFHFLKVSSLEWRGKGRHLKKSSVNSVGLEPKTFGIDAPCLLHEMCWCPQRGFFIGLHKTWLGKNGILLRDQHLFEHNSLFVAIWVEVACGNTSNLERDEVKICNIYILVDLQLDAQNSYLFTYNTFIKILYMFRALSCSSSGGLHHNCTYAASGIVTV